MYYERRYSWRAIRLAGEGGVVAHLEGFCLLLSHFSEKEEKGKGERFSALSFGANSLGAESFTRELLKRGVWLSLGKSGGGRLKKTLPTGPSRTQTLTSRARAA